MRKLNIRLWTRRLTLTAREAPAEMLLALYFFAIYSLNREHVLNGPTDYLLLMPIFFALSLLTNRWCRSPRSRIVYRLSPLAAVPFLWADVGGWVHSVAYPVTLIVSALTVFAGGWQRDNARFVERVLRYLSDAIASGLIALRPFWPPAPFSSRSCTSSTYWTTARGDSPNTRLWRRCSSSGPFCS